MSSFPSTTSAGISGFAYGIIFSIGMLLLITAVMFTAHLCQSRRRGRMQSATIAEPEEDLRQGLDEEALSGCPKVTIAAVEGSKDACCCICLSDYGDDDVLRLLPDCGHMFHAACVDSWLRWNPTCPICRTSPMPSIMKGPVAGTMPAAGEDG